MKAMKILFGAVLVAMLAVVLPCRAGDPDNPAFKSVRTSWLSITSVDTANRFKIDGVAVTATAAALNSTTALNDSTLIDLSTNKVGGLGNLGTVQNADLADATLVDLATNKVGALGGLSTVQNGDLADATLVDLATNKVGGLGGVGTVQNADLAGSVDGAKLLAGSSLSVVDGGSVTNLTAASVSAGLLGPRVAVSNRTDTTFVGPLDANGNVTYDTANVTKTYTVSDDYKMFVQPNALGAITNGQALGAVSAVYTISAAGPITATVANASAIGQCFRVINTGAQDIFLLDTGNLKLSADAQLTADDVLSLYSADGTNWWATGAVTAN